MVGVGEMPTPTVRENMHIPLHRLVSKGCGIIYNHIYTVCAAILSPDIGSFAGNVNRFCGTNGLSVIISLSMYM